MSRRLSSERGQDTVEWAGVLLVVGLMIGAFLASGILASVASAVACNVNKVLGGAVICVHQPSQPSLAMTRSVTAGPGGSAGAHQPGPGRFPRGKAGHQIWSLRS